MNKMSYLCRAERQVRVKANASNPDRHLNLNAPSRGCQVCRTSKPGICKSSFSEGRRQVKQHGFFACVYRFSTATKGVSTDSVNEEKKCLVKSGKVKMCLVPVRNMAPFSEILSRIQRFPLRKVGVSPKESPGLV